MAWSSDAGPARGRRLPRGGRTLANPPAARRAAPRRRGGLGQDHDDHRRRLGSPARRPGGAVLPRTAGCDPPPRARHAHRSGHLAGTTDRWTRSLARRFDAVVVTSRFAERGVHPGGGTRARQARTGRRWGWTWPRSFPRRWRTRRPRVRGRPPRPWRPRGCRRRRLAPSAWCTPGDCPGTRSQNCWWPRCASWWRVGAACTWISSGTVRGAGISSEPPRAAGHVPRLCRRTRRARSAPGRRRHRADPAPG